MKRGTEALLGALGIAAALTPILWRPPTPSRSDSVRVSTGDPIPPPVLTAQPVAEAYAALRGAENAHEERFSRALDDDFGWSALRAKIAAADRAKDEAQLASLGLELFEYDVPRETPRATLSGANRCAACHAHGRPGGSGGMIDDGFEGMKPPSLEGATLLARAADEINADLARARKSGARVQSHGIDFSTGLPAGGLVRPFGREGRWSSLDEAITEMAKSAVGFSPSASEISALRAFIASRPAPIIQPPDSGRMPDLFRRFELGRERFRAVGCANCHVPEITLLDGTVVRAFTDFKIHDLGSTVDSHGRTRWQTAPLWGIAGAAPWMHDGRALASLDLAIDMHHGEADASRKAYQAGDFQERGEIKTFLLSLTPKPQFRVAGP